MRRRPFLNRKVGIGSTIAIVPLVAAATLAYACTNFVGVLEVWGNNTGGCSGAAPNGSCTRATGVVATGTDTWNGTEAMTQTVDSTIAEATTFREMPCTPGEWWTDAADLKIYRCSSDGVWMVTTYTFNPPCTSSNNGDIWIREDGTVMECTLGGNWVSTGQNRGGGQFYVEALSSGFNSLNQGSTSIWYDVNTVPVGYSSHTTWGGGSEDDCMDFDINGSSGTVNHGSVEVNRSGTIIAATTGPQGSGNSVTLFSTTAGIAGPYSLSMNEIANTSPEESAVCLSDSSSTNGNQAPLTVV